MGQRLSDEELLDDLCRLRDELGKVPTSSDVDEQGKYSYATYRNRYGTFKNAREKAGLPREFSGGPSKDALLDDLRRLHDELGKIPATSDVTEHGQYGSNTYRRRFGSIKDAREKAGLPREIESKRRISSEEMLEDLRRLEDELDRVPKKADIESEGKYSDSLYSERFGSIKNAREEAGLSRNVQAKRKVTNESLLSELRRLYNELGKTPSPDDIHQHGKYGKSVYYRRFGSIKDARENAGIPRNVDVQYVSDEELLDDLRRLQDELGRPPSSVHVTERGNHSVAVYGERFGSMAAARDKAGLASDVRSIPRLSEETLIGALKHLRDELGRIPTSSDMDKHGDHSHNSYVLRFGSFEEARVKAGMPRSPRWTQTSESELLEELRRLQDVLGRTPKQSDMKEHSKYSEQVYISRFGSFTKAREIAGLKEYADTRHRHRVDDEELLGDLQTLKHELGRTPSSDDIDQYGTYSTSMYLDRFGSIMTARKKSGVGEGENLGHRWESATNVYGRKAWKALRKKIILRDGEQCVTCEISRDTHINEYGQDLHVHHRTPARQFDEVSEGDTPDNLVTLCCQCHMKWEHLPIQPQVSSE